MQSNRGVLHVGYRSSEGQDGLMIIQESSFTPWSGGMWGGGGVQVVWFTGTIKLNGM